MSRQLTLAPLLIALCFSDCFSDRVRIDDPREFLGTYESKTLGLLEFRPDGVLFQRVAGRQVEARWTHVISLSNSCYHEVIFKGLVHDAAERQTNEEIYGTVHRSGGRLYLLIDREGEAHKT